MNTTMKKYIKPSVEVNEVIVENMLALSVTGNSSTDNKMYSNGRRRNGWDVDW